MTGPFAPVSYISVLFECLQLIFYSDLLIEEKDKKQKFH